MIAEAEMWDMVSRRDPRGDGRFVYGVRTTGIFCRPTCPSRRPARGNVRFFATPGGAQAAGFRACLRCRPVGASPAREQLALVRAACTRLQSGEAEPSLAELAAAAGMSGGHFQRVFRRTVGISPKQYAIACREQRFRDALRSGGRVTDAVYAAGYNSAGVAYAAARRGMAPARYRDRAPGVTVRYALAPTDLGWVAVAATERGICAVELADDAHTLRDSLRQQFEQARLLEDRDGLGALVEAVVGFVERPAAALDLPLDIQGTAFQRRVWQALREIPVGETRSYGEIARDLDAPRAARAVASACASNAIALAIPCHRVVRGDGRPGGYRWGVERKCRLLERERHWREPAGRGHTVRPPGGSDGEGPQMPISVEVVTSVTPELEEAMARLLPQLSSSAPAPDRDTLREIVASPCTLLLAARDGDRIVGSLTLAMFRLPTGLRAWIEDVVVDSGARGRGIGEALSRRALELARAEGAVTVDLTSRPSREAANRLYRRIGFEERETNVYRYRFE